MPSKKILLIEDDPNDEFLVLRALAKDYLVKCVSSSKDAFRILKEESFSLILLDISLPADDGFHICTELKTQESTRDIPIFFLTGQLSASDKVMGFSLGGDDYIAKPFEPAELRARIEAKLKKQQIHEAPHFSKSGIRLDFDRQKAFVTLKSEEKDINLTSIEFKLLHYFLRHEEHVLSRDKILEVLWGHDNHVTDRTIDTHIYTLRKKLGSKRACIQSVHRIGYKFCLSAKNRKAS